MRNAMIIDAKDNVAVAIEPIAKGDTVTYVCGGKDVSLIALEDITIYHKLATRDIAKGEPVVKYGEHIGIASCDIKTGEHVHVHNVEGHRENLEAKE
ncbi:UxaA family hydrolase [Dysosmobacter sp.]|uniref:UxaA family hydrolase n=1 Tax=Dysosmobacter sp. TaxID=2591382 RepID=UPI002A87CCFD|nr:UxaA family hydrolase [Dysosmobacter sp.]MDY3984039.1 UxaA family hydrolase [Dysosmobacter sp.]